jgi:formate dehydrogenase alpha subunit
MIQLTIDGHPVKVAKGATVLQACDAAGVHVPTLCDDPDLVPYGACRFCIVKIDGVRGLPTSCTTPVAEGMTVTTDDDEIRRVRTMTAQLLLSDHPRDCLTCASNGNCGLQTIAADLGITERVLRPMERKVELDDSNPCFTFDLGMCVLCGICVRTCEEVQGLGAIDLVRRGFDTAVQPFGEVAIRDSICESCGECVERCPTGALAPRGFLPPQRETSSVCPYCGTGCLIKLGTRGDRIVSARGDRSSPVAQGRLCVKGRFGAFEFVNHPDRLTSPLIREGDGFREASWDEALALVADRLKCVPGHAFGGLASAKVPNEDNYVFQKFTRAVMGSNNVDHCARLCHSSTVAGLAASFGSGAMTNTVGDLGEADAILVTGSNTTESHPIIGLEIRKAVERGTELLVFDPRRISLTRRAAVWGRQLSGTDVVWINGLMHVILREGLHDQAFIDERTEGFEAVRDAVAAYTPERVEAISGIPAADIERAARIYGRAERAAIVYSMGITQHTTGVDAVRSLANLAMLTGNIGRRGTGVNPLRGQNNVQGACDLGALPNVFPGYQKVADDEARAKFEAAWDVTLSPEPGLTVTEMLSAALEGDLHALYIMGENPMVSDPDVTHVEEALRTLDFLVVQDLFLTETARLADVVLPAVSYAERDGTYTNTERLVQRTEPVIRPLRGARRDWQILCDVARRLGYAMEYEDTEAVSDEIRSLTPSYAGISYDRLRAGENLHWPCPDESHPGTPILHAGQFARGKGAFHPVEYLPPAELPDGDYPLTLTTGRVLVHFHSLSMTGRSEGLLGLEPECFVEVNEADAARLEVEDSEYVRVSTRRGEVTARARVGSRVPGGTIFMPFHYGDQPANRLTNPAVDPTAKIPEYKVCGARIDKLEEAISTL